MAKFNGIAEYHDGLAVSDYINMIPLGETCIDRQGEELVDGSIDEVYNVRGTFMDSMDNIYVVIASKVYRFIYNRIQNSVSYVGPMTAIVNGQAGVLELLHTNGDVTFAESSTKPSQVYLCDGKYIYWWATTDTFGYPAERQSFIVTMMYSPGVELNSIDKTTRPDQYANLLHLADDLNVDNIANIDSIDWFDNKLVATQKEKNTVWLTCTDPGQFFRDAALDPWGDANDLWHNWYSSSNSADRLTQAVAFGGQLYLLNSLSIEIWGRTGNEDAPLQANTLQVIHHGARNPLIISDTLYVIASDQVGSEYIAAIRGGQFQKISNAEIDRRLGNPYDLQVLSQRDESYLFVRDSDNGAEQFEGFVYRDGKWWRWENAQSCTQPIRNTIVRNISVTRGGWITRFTDETRKTVEGELIRRVVRDSFQMFQKRMIIRRVRLVMDTGRANDFPDISLEERNRMIYLSISTNRGLSFTIPRYRSLGRSGLNNKEVEWRNLGSSNSILVEFGTTANYNLQVYDVSIDLA